MPEYEPESEREVVVSRLIEGPRALVFEVFTEAQHVKQWWGPDGFTTTTHAFDFRVGGVWDYTMHGPDGTDFPNWIEWREIVPPARIVALHGAHADDPEAFVSTFTFVERDGGTEVTLRSVLPTKAFRDKVVKEYGAIEGGEQTLGRLAEYVECAARSR
ncbi:MAG: SRPBCC family protein [Chloroflexi bacterium]|nr:SRPBCC family protein [Chloroflexota bacterium]MDA1241023.1 SRPBCC family protein [Chloroflexota bacterium]